MIRATIVCVDGDGILEAWKRCSSDAGFRITPDHGRVKNSFRSKDELPKLLCNAMVYVAGYLPIVAEIQILLLGVYEIKSFNHREFARRCRAAGHHGTPNRRLLPDSPRADDRGAARRERDQAARAKRAR